MHQQVGRQSASFINESAIYAALEEGKQRASRDEAEAIIKKAALADGLTLEEVAVLLNVHDPELVQEIYKTAKQIKLSIYGKRLVLFAPLYVSDYCINNCVYCGYGAGHKFARRKLTMDEVKKETLALIEMGHKRIAMEAGEDPDNCPIEYVLDAIGAVYSVHHKNVNIRRININIAATTVENYKRLKDAEIGTYILFQETYHRETYAKMHPRGPKSDYDYHTTAFDRAMQGGIDDVGAGVLFGLYDHKFELLGLLQTAQHLEAEFGCGPHTISVPRIRPAGGINLSSFPHIVSDDEFKKLIAIIRMAVPYTGMIITTREEANFRNECLELGISQLSGGSCTGVGGYCEENANGVKQPTQFQVNDERPLDQVMFDIAEAGHLPSFCTACYRNGRTGDRFMAMAKIGEIQNLCQPNAILTFKEYLVDFASPDTRELGEKIIAEHLKQIPNPKLRRKTEEQLAKIEAGKRDFYF
ncbi:MAG TPA: [FeFe] hydrogenase H-cluster radical SAM maturase HydG [Rhizomicrobium sp.]|nr:[FeFe] hydrogenase H-cluster radical SAM maturase HydG [Rhizomicrobium sp.]